jgi:transcriptional regulator with XRE-family HTH domain
MDLSAIEMTEFAERLKALRLSRKLTQGRLAELVGVSLRMYHRWESGQSTPYLDTLVKLADVLDITADELLGREPLRDDQLVHNQELHNLVRQVDQLSDDDQQALIAVMDGLVKRTQIGKMARGEPAAAAPRKTKTRRAAGH